MSNNQQKKTIKEPKYKIGDIVFVHSEVEKGIVLQGVIKSAQYVEDWFYQIEVKNPTSPLDEPEWIYSYEENTGDAKTKFLSTIDKALKETDNNN